METTSSYSPPELLNDMDEETIHAKMLEVIPGTLDKTEGGFVWDFTRPAAIEKADAMIVLNEIVKLFFPEWSNGEYLDKIGAVVGVTRRAPTPAETTIHVTGVAGTEIPAGFLFSTAATAISENIEFETIEVATLDSDGEADILVRCTQTGTVGNVPAGSITLMASPMTGITEVNNESAATGGTETEEDESLRERIMQVDRSLDLSYVGCDADYKRWAQEIDGVGDVIVVPEWEGTGTGTVKLVVMDAQGQPANATILNNVYNHIVSPTDRAKRLAPIGAILTVVTATLVTLTISAEVTLEEDATLADVEEAFEASLRSYFEEVKAEGIEASSGIGYIRYTRVGSILSSTTGVKDYENLLINSDTENVAIEQDKYPDIGTLTITEGT